jgi:hypothetical protein
VCLLPDDSVGTFARELWWTSQGFPLPASSHYGSAMFMYDVGHEQKPMGPRLGLEQCQTEISVCITKQDLTDGNINYDDSATWPVALNSAIRDHIVW